MQNINEIDFHESTVTKFSTKDHVVVIEIKDVLVDSSKCNFRIKCLNIEGIKIDDNMTCEVTMALPDGEILTLEINENELFLIIEWNDFKEKKMFIESYQIKCQKIQVEELSRREASESEFPGYEGEAHYHRFNPNRTSERDEYLDKYGNPCPRGSNESHLYPGD